MSNVVRVSLSLEPALAEQLEHLMAQTGFRNRSEYVRSLLRERLVREQWNASEPVVGTLTVVYNHHQRGVAEKLVELQHRCGETVLASTHVHLSHEICAEMIMLRGDGAAIEQLACAVRKLRGVLHAELTMSTTGENLS